MKSDIISLRITLALYVILYGAFAVLDYSVAKEYLNDFLIIRFFIVIPFLLLVIVLSFTKLFHKIYQFLLSSAVVVGGIGIAYMLVKLPDNNAYYGGLFMVIYSGFFLVKLYYKYAFMAFVVIFAYLSIHFFVISDSGITQNMLFMLIFYLSSGIIGVVGGYYLDSFKYSTYITTNRLIEHEKNLVSLVDEKVNEVIESQIVTIFAIAKIVEERDKCTGTHIENVGHYCKIIAENISGEIYKEYKIDKKEFLETIEIASALHDIGKVGISDVILNKPTKLTKEEFEQIKLHPIIGSKNLENIQDRYKHNRFINMGIDIARYHHERFDGNGYPMNLKGSAIPLSAQIMAISDVYDALTSKRPYKLAFSHSTAIEIILEQEDGHFNPELLAVFDKVQDKLKKVKFHLN